MVEQLKEVTQEVGLLNFCDIESSHVLLGCVLHGTDEVGI